MARGRVRLSGLDDLFSVDSRPLLRNELAVLPWPDLGRFPVNHARSSVRRVVWADLVGAQRPLVVAGFASIAQIIDLVGDRAAAGLIGSAAGAAGLGAVRQ